ncbi:unnamed protein product [Pleuronectes platessa]|uniref:Uncharacterized protein n=1 Tax=Pleuronectes platessa TaxID=8262 RepID=A0A9N7VUF5_PLEPL|nr:unnamed protein product [Pleuronectes platessa]
MSVKINLSLKRIDFHLRFFNYHLLLWNRNIYASKSDINCRSFWKFDINVFLGPAKINLLCSNFFVFTSDVCRGDVCPWPCSIKMNTKASKTNASAPFSW